jgi:hypothetical protein
MSKKYSVQTENDEVVSVAVDGVTYTHPDDIPDKQDRAKIHAMIARVANGDDGMDESFDKEFDREFAADMRELERSSAVFPRLLMGIFLGIALITLTIAVISGYNTLRQISREESAPGRVVELVERTSRDSETGDVTEYSYPVVEFTPPGRQQPVTVQIGEGSWPPAYLVGDAVTVLYEPGRPQIARIQSASSNLLMWILPGITGIVGISFLIAGVVVFKVFSPPAHSVA